MDNGTLCPADEPDFITAAVRAGFPEDFISVYS